MNDLIIREVSARLNIGSRKVSAVLDLLAEGATVPFIARYRKDATGAMDEVQIQQIRDEAQSIQEFLDRKEFIEKTIREQDKMTEELQKQLDAARTLHELEDIYLPYKPRRRTRAQIAREAGLEPLAEWLMEQEEGSVEQKAESYLNDEVEDVKAALKGARDIIAEVVSEDAEIRGALRDLFEKEAKVKTLVFETKKAEAAKYKDYFDFSELYANMPSHRALAVLRGNAEGFLRFAIEPDPEDALALLKDRFLKSSHESGQQVEEAIEDSYKRLLQPSLETELRSALKVRSDEDAIQVFSENLRQLLLSPPLGNKNLIAIDPGYRTGCKVVALDRYGRLLDETVIYVHEKNYRLQEAESILREWIQKHKAEGFAIGNGTAGRETEQFVRSLQPGIPVFLINEDGASVYSASEVAREELPDEDITVRGAVSIGRRLMDPLAELVKIDPKSIGVGQYQHDVNQFRLKDKLDETVESCVNAVGVNLNTSGKYLLRYVSGIGPSLAENIVKYRDEKGGFKTRKELLEVPRLGPKAYEQCAGFLRISDGEEVLDATGVHPEAYPLVKKIARDLNVTIPELMNNEKLSKTIDPKKYISESYGLHTVTDVIEELAKPGRDPRSELQIFEFAEVYSPEDLSEGMILPGVVTNITRFGAFVDVGVKQDGLVHISEIANRFISDPAEVLKLNQKVSVKVLEVDLNRNRISLSIKQAQPDSGRKRRPGRRGKSHKKEVNMDEALKKLQSKFNR